MHIYYDIQIIKTIYILESSIYCIKSRRSDFQSQQVINATPNLIIFAFI